MVLITAFVASATVTPASMWLARRVNVLDRPGELKVQTAPIPHLGGLGVAAGLAIGVVASRPVLSVPLAVALVLGIVDDARGVSPWVRLVAEIAVGLLAAAVVPTRSPGAVGFAAVAILVVLLVNAVNMIDGLDGLAGGVALMSALGFALVLGGDGRSLALALVGGLAGFLLFNRPPAKVYLGDGGAYLVGTALALLLATAWHEGTPLALSLGSLPLVACPLAELACAALRRIRARTPLFAGDRGHGYDRLVAGGWSRNSSVGAYIAAQAAFAGVAVGAVRLQPSAAAAASVACALVLLSAVAALGFLDADSSGARP